MSKRITGRLLNKYFESEMTTGARVISSLISHEFQLNTLQPQQSPKAYLLHSLEDEQPGIVEY
jgi:hypothetical protein